MATLSSKSNLNSQKQKKDSDFEASMKANIKELLTEFREYSKRELRLVLEICEYNLSAAQLYLDMISKPKVKATITNYLNGKFVPNLASLGIPLDEINLRVSKEESKLAEEAKKEEEDWIPTGPNLFEENCSNQMLYSILDFLDPASLGKAGFTCKRFYQISQYPTLFKKFCKKLYSQYPPLPTSSPFNSLLQRMNAVGRFEFDEGVLAQANDNIRSLVWLPSITSFYTPASYYRQFKNMKEIFLNAPRIRFAGVYMMKEKYIRVGTNEQAGFYNPYHEVEFFRYLKFFSNGLVMSTLSVNKLKQEKLLRIFSPTNALEGEDQEVLANTSLKYILSGEYMIQKGRVHIRLGAKSTIYEFDVEINSSAPGFFDQLRMVSQHMRLVGGEHREQLNKVSNDSEVFKFIKNSRFV